MRLRDRLGIDERQQRRFTRLMELALVGLLFIGIDDGNLGVVVTAAIALAVTKLPAVLERDYGLELDAGLTLWITTAVFLHAVGVGGIPGIEGSLYGRISTYHHLTHAMSASVVAGVGYVTVRAFDRHSEHVRLTSRFTFVFVLLFVMAFGVFWELVEFGVGVATASAGMEAVGFTQHGLGDTMLDLVFNTIGGVIVAAWGHAHLTGVVGHLQRRLEARGTD